MLETNKIRAAVQALGWPKASYCVCLLLLFRGVVTFDQCLLLMLCALLFHLLPRRGDFLAKGKSVPSPRRRQ